MKISTIGLDLAKNWFQVHGVDADGKVVVRPRLRRSEIRNERFSNSLFAFRADRLQDYIIWQSTRRGYVFVTG
jgi:transposase